jgi:hypothetical protein
MVGDALNKPKKHSNKRKKPETNPEALSEKEFLEVYNLLEAFAKLLEEAQRKPKLPKLRMKGQHAMMARDVEAPRGPRHLGRAIARAETWQERDQVCRRVSSYCFARAKESQDRGDSKGAQRWMALSHRYFKLAMDPKKQITEEKLKELEEMVYKIKEHQKEAKDKTPKP